MSSKYYNKPSDPTTSKQKEVTILLLGESGVGKSTWINGFANFLEFGSLAEAQSNPVHCLIPASFTLTDEASKSKVVTTGSDPNEVTSVGKSSTQQPMSYVFPNARDGVSIRLIDTPGVGDTKGPEQDKKNFQLILNHISDLKEVHGICILLKPNNAKLNIMFRFCIKELLTHLHKDAARNIVFCFTNSRSTFYKPGDTLPALEKLLAETRHQVDLPLCKQTLYCMDNESIRFLYAVNAGMRFTDKEYSSFADSWGTSMAEVNRLIDHISGLNPHQIKNTLSLNNARQTILALTQPMAEISRSIQESLAKEQRRRAKLKNNQLTKEELSKQVVLEVTQVHMKNLKEPRTICTAPKCVDVISVDSNNNNNNGGNKQVNYRSTCHRNCGQGKKKHYNIAGIVGHRNLKKCSAFDFLTGNCKVCGCSWKDHMKITYETYTRTRNVIDTDKEDEVKEKEKVIISMEEFLETLDGHIRELRFEQVEITNASVIFASFLKRNAIAPYNESVLSYIDQFINEEKRKVGCGGSSEVLQGLEQLRTNYKEQLETLLKAIEGEGSGEGTTTTDSPEDLEKLIQALFRLKYFGQNLRELTNSCLVAGGTQAKHVEKEINSVRRIKRQAPLAPSSAAHISRNGSPLRTFNTPEIKQPVHLENEKRGRKPSPPPRQRPSYPDIRTYVIYNDPPRRMPSPPPPAGVDYDAGYGTSIEDHNYPLDIPPKVEPVKSGKSDVDVRSNDQQYTAINLIERHEIKVRHRLGEGGFGYVCMGEWQYNPCAIKQVKSYITNDVTDEHILKEARIQFSLNHPNIVKLYGISFDYDLWMVLELVDGKDLYKMLLDKHSKEKIAYGFKLKIACQTTNAISHIHSKGYVHNDIKPENIMIERGTGHVRICDFGITRYLGKSDIHEHTRKFTNSFAGTLPYMAPECFQRDESGRYRRPTYKSDVWALGAVFTELFLEKPLFADEKELYACKYNDDFIGLKRTISKLPTSVRPIIADALGQSPDQRPTAKKMNEFFLRMRT